MFLKNEDTEIPDMYLCPILRELMTDPVVAADGHTYERRAIKRWIKNEGTSPMTRARISDKSVIPNQALKQVIEAFVKAENDKYDQMLKHLQSEVAKLKVENAAHAAAASASASASAGAREATKPESMRHPHHLRNREMDPRGNVSNGRRWTPRSRDVADNQAVRALVNQANELAESDHHQAAVPLFEEAIEAGLDNSFVLNRYANSLNRLGQHKRAITIFNKVLRQQTDNLYATKGRGFALEQLGSYAEAIRSFTNAIKLSPDDQASIKALKRLSKKLDEQAGDSASSRARDQRHTRSSSASGHVRLFRQRESGHQSSHSTSRYRNNGSTH